MSPLGTMCVILILVPSVGTGKHEITEADPVP